MTNNAGTAHNLAVPALLMDLEILMRRIQLDTHLRLI